MGLYLLKVLISAIIIVAVSETAKRHPIAGAILASVPIVSVLAILWLYWSTHSITAVSTLSRGVFWLVLPSLIFFVLLPVFLKSKISFGWSMSLALAIMIAGYSLMVTLLKIFSIKI